MADLYIIAAGKGSRMNSAIPKALIPITDKPNLTTTLQQIGGKFDKVFVATNVSIQSQWAKYFDDLSKEYPELAKNVVNVPIVSGRGDGHAVLETIWETSAFSPSENMVIAWGDVFFPASAIVDELLARRMDSYMAGIVPVLWERDPYVTIKVDEQMGITHAEFSKFGETSEEGYHDQSVFRFNRRALEQSLSVLDVVMNRNGKYLTPNGELSLLHVFHYIYNTTQEGGPEVEAYETKYPTMSFNTVEEVAMIQTQIDSLWKRTHRPNQSS